MNTMTMAIRCAMNCALTFALSTALVAAAATPAAKPTPNTHTVTVGGQTSTYANLPGAPVGGEASAAYQFRTRVSTAPQCSRFGTEADTVFLNDKMDGAAKATQLNKIGADAGAAGCLVP